MSILDTQVVELKALTAKTKELLKNRPVHLTYNKISDETGLKYSWLNKFACSDHLPSTVRVNILYNYLISKQLKSA